MTPQHFLTIKDYSAEQIQALLDRTQLLKQEHQDNCSRRSLLGKTLALIFQKPSNRTRISFEVGMYQLGGSVVFIKPEDIRMGEREPIADIARVMSRYVDAVMLRTFSHSDLIEFSDFASVPVINGLSDIFHPCQALADVFTMVEKLGSARGKKLVFVGDGNNVCNSLINIAAKTGFEVVVSCPPGHDPDAEVVDGHYTIQRDPWTAVSLADVIYTDVWTSMGQEEESSKRKRIFHDYSVTMELLRRAQKNAIFMHCLPAHRGEEAADEVVESPQSVVFDQAENRLHAQKAILETLIIGDTTG
jgi:ornithine carbamoyltransferase